MVIETAPGFYTGLEYNLNPAGGEWPGGIDDVFKHGSPRVAANTYQFADFHSLKFPDGEETPLVSVGVRYFEKEIIEVPGVIDPDTGEQAPPTYIVNITYPAWSLVSQSMYKAESKRYFEIEEGVAERSPGTLSHFFVSPPGPYVEAFAGLSEFITGPPPRPQPLPFPDDPLHESFNIRNRFLYGGVFDQTELQWYPRLSSDRQQVLDSRMCPLPRVVAPEPIEPFHPRGRPIADGVTIAAGGSGYRVGGSISVKDAEAGVGMTVNILSVNADGAVTQVEMDEPGLDYYDKENITINAGDENCVLTVENPPVFPYDVVTSYLADEREKASITYTLVTLADKAGGAITVIHPIVNEEIDARSKIRTALNLGYFGRHYNDGLEHVGLYPPLQEHIYTADGRREAGDLQIGGEEPERIVNEPLILKQLQRKTYPFDKVEDDWRPFPEEPF